MGNVNSKINEEKETVVVTNAEEKAERTTKSWKKYVIPAIGFIVGALAGAAGDHFLMNRSKTTTTETTEDAA